MGFVLSRSVVDEAEILTVAIAPEARGRGHSRPLLTAHLEGLSSLESARFTSRSRKATRRRLRSIGASASAKSAGARGTISRPTKPGPRPSP